MELLHEESHAAVNITIAGEVLRFTSDSLKPLAVLARVTLGAISPIAGGQNYTLRTLVNSVIVSPDSVFAVPGGQASAVAQSRQLLLLVGDELVVQAIGAPADISVDSVAVLFDVTPARTVDLVSSGSVLVDHDYGGQNNLRVLSQSSGAPIADVAILVYRQDDYDDNRRQADFIRGRSTTDSGGFWRNPVMLDPGEYVLVHSKPSEYLTAVRAVTVL